MEKIKKFKSLIDFESDLFVRILAVIIAVIVWVVLSITKYPTTTLKIASVPVIFSLDGTKAEANGLRAVGYNDITTMVEIQGMKYEIGGYTNKDIIASVNVDQVTKEGTYSLKISAVPASTSDQCKVLSCSPDTVDVTFEHYGQETFPITAQAHSVTAADDLVIRHTTVSPSEVTITGSDENLNKIEKVVANISDSKELSENTTLSTSDLVFYDKYNKRLSSEDYTVDNKNFDVIFTLFKQVNAELSIDFEDTPPGFDLNSLPYSLSEDNVQIWTSDLDAKSDTKKTLGSISLKDVNLEKSYEFNIPLDSGEENAGESDKIQVTFDGSGYTSKEINLSKSSFTFVNKSTGKNVTVSSPNAIKPVIYGPESVISELEASDLTAEINLNNISKSGDYTLPITIYAKKYNTVWCYGTYKARVIIS